MPIPNLQNAEDLTFLEPSGTIPPRDITAQRTIADLYRTINLLQLKVNELVTRVNLLTNELEDI